MCVIRNNLCSSKSKFKIGFFLSSKKAAQVFTKQRQPDKHKIADKILDCVD